MKLEVEVQRFRRVAGVQNRAITAPDGDHVEARARAHRDSGAVLIVPVVHVGIDIDRAEDQIRKAVASREGHRAFFGHRNVEEPGHVDRANLGFAVHSIAIEASGVRRHHTADRPAIAGRGRAGIELDAADQAGMNRGRTER